MIYFIGIQGTSYVKVGKAVSPTKRLATLSTAHPVDLSLLRVIKTYGPTEDSILERRIHSYLEEFRVKREWFEIDSNKLNETVNHFENSEQYRLNPVLEGRYICLRTSVQREADGNLYTVTETCFFCHVKHLHGAIDSVQIIDGIHTYGHRVAHCQPRDVRRRHPNGIALCNNYGYYLWIENP